MELVPNVVSRTPFLMSKDKLFTPRIWSAARLVKSRRRESSPLSKPSAVEKVATIGTSVLTLLPKVRLVDSHKQFFDSPRRSRRIDTSPFRDHNCVYVTPAEVGQARRVRQVSESRPTKDGAKIYFCYRRCCFLSWERRSCLLHRLSPRKSRFQSHPSEVRSVSQRRSRHDESVSARRSLRHRRRR